MHEQHSLTTHIREFLSGDPLSCCDDGVFLAFVIGFGLLAICSICAPFLAVKSERI